MILNGLRQVKFLVYLVYQLTYEYSLTIFINSLTSSVVAMDDQHFQLMLVSKFKESLLDRSQTSKGGFSAFVLVYVMILVIHHKCQVLKSSPLHSIET